MNEWKVVFIPNAQVWPIQGLVGWEQSPDGTRVAVIPCSSVQAHGNGFLELGLLPAPGTDAKPLTLLVRQDQVLLAVRMHNHRPAGFSSSDPFPVSIGTGTPEASKPG